MQRQEMVLNIRYDAPAEIWDKIPSIYKQLDGWLGYGKDGIANEKGLPYWFSFNEEDKHITVSVELGGLQFMGLMDDAGWELWAKEIKRIATKELGYKVGEIAAGEVDYLSINLTSQ